MPKYTFVPAHTVKKRAPLIFALSGMSESGKTYSALLIAQAISRALGKPVIAGDTEAGRITRYNDPEVYPELNPFLYTEIDEPYAPREFDTFIKDAREASPACIIIDSFTDEWEGPGGVLNSQETALERMAGEDDKKREKLSPRAWAEAKKDHTALFNTIYHLRIPIILCHRARPKTGFVKGKFIDIGVQPICDWRLTYDFTFHLLMDEEKKDGTYKSLKAGYKHEREIFGMNGKVDAAAIDRLLVTMKIKEPDEPSAVWEAQEDLRYKCTKGDPDSVEAKRELFRILRKHFANDSKTDAMNVFEANKYLIRSMPEEATTALYGQIAALEDHEDERT